MTALETLIDPQQAAQLRALLTAPHNTHEEDN
jgi:hypothetical protein